MPLHLDIAERPVSGGRAVAIEHDTSWQSRKSLHGENREHENVAAEVFVDTSGWFPLVDSTHHFVVAGFDVIPGGRARSEVTSNG